jgi:hypothetical protein
MAPQAADLAARASLLLPVYRVKWSCILLHEFVPASAARRQFSRGSNTEER